MHFCILFFFVQAAVCILMHVLTQTGKVMTRNRLWSGSRLLLLTLSEATKFLKKISQESQVCEINDLHTSASFCHWLLWRLSVASLAKWVCFRFLLEQWSKCQVLMEASSYLKTEVTLFRCEGWTAELYLLYSVCVSVCVACMHVCNVYTLCCDEKFWIKNSHNYDTKIVLNFFCWWDPVRLKKNHTELLLACGYESVLDQADLLFF